MRIPPADAIRILASHLITEGPTRPILSASEARLPRTEVMDELRPLTSFGMDADYRFCLLFAGPTILRRRFALAVFASLTQRLAMQHRMTGLDRDVFAPHEVASP